MGEAKARSADSRARSRLGRSVKRDGIDMVVHTLAEERRPSWAPCVTGAGKPPRDGGPHDHDGSRSYPSSRPHTRAIGGCVRLGQKREAVIATRPGEAAVRPRPGEG